MRARKGNIYVGTVLAMMLAALVMAAVLASAQVSLARWTADRGRDAQAFYAALTGLERLKPLCAELLDPRAAVRGTTVEVPDATGPVGGQALVDRVILTYTHVSAYTVEADAVSVGISENARVAVKAPIRANWTEDEDSNLVFAGASFMGPAVRVPVP